MSNTLCAYTNKSSYFPNERVVFFINNPYSYFLTNSYTYNLFGYNYSLNGNALTWIEWVRNHGNTVLYSQQTTGTPGIQFLSCTAGGYAPAARVHQEYTTTLAPKVWVTCKAAIDVPPCQGHPIIPQGQMEFSRSIQIFQ